MNLDLNFKSVCTAIKNQSREDPKLLEAVDQLLGLALVCSPIIIGPSAAPLLPLLAQKNELTKIGSSVFQKLTKKKDRDYLARHETMRTAYGLLVFTAFFDALDARLSRPLRKEFLLLDTAKSLIAKQASQKCIADTPEAIRELHDAPVSNYAVAFPHPTETLTEQCQRQARLWQTMRQGFVEFVQHLSFWEAADEKKKATLLRGLDKIEEEAAKRFEAQYYELARRFEDFAVWANLQAHQGTKALIGQLSDYVRLHARLSAASETSIDVGFAELRETVLSLPEIFRVQQATEIADSLNKHYRARIDDPIIEDKDSDDENAPRLSFPKISEAFIPQAFRVVRQIGKSRRLEDESTWADLPRRNDLGGFLLSYLSSPYSTEAPLLILGHPGSGKSLLTTLLSAQLMSKHFTAIRVPLREVNADADIMTQIEEAIRQITGVSVDSWIKLSARFKNSPPLVILDGYDELLQASGQVFASYIKDAQRFQEREAEQGRPLRIIITSRVTLIDKAAVPHGSTIVRLLEFDQRQRNLWSGIWNRANIAYFRDTGIEEFSLPSEKERGAEQILNLAEQPLLLLMLALYDSQDNQLRNSQGLDRTNLYDSLLRRFIVRERGKEKGFSDAVAKEREFALSTEMQRLGVAALGMYNRRKVHILAPELDDDLAFFRLERETAPESRIALSQADLLLGSFFFVHKSRAQHSSGADDSHQETAAFEFLHNTFGEFLTADFILRRAVAQVKALQAAESNEALRSTFDKMLGTADGFERDWFASLVYTPLFTRPVVMEMIREWTPHVLNEYQLSEGSFLNSLEQIILNQITRLLNKREMPQIMRKETAQEGYRVPFSDHPLLGHIAIYSINLILLRLISATGPYVFDESQIESHEDGTRPWDRLLHIWRSWFALGNLNGLTAVMVAERSESRVTITAKSKFQAEESKTKLHEVFHVARAVGDNVSAGMTGFCLFDPNRDSGADFDDLQQRLKSENIELGLSAKITSLLIMARRFDRSPEEFLSVGVRALEEALGAGRRDHLEYVCTILARTLDEHPHFPGRNTLVRDLLQPSLFLDTALRAPRAARILLEVVGVPDRVWFSEMSERLVVLLFQELTHSHGLELSSSHWINLVRLLREIRERGGRRHVRTIDRAMFKRKLHPRQLLEISEQNPEGALAYLQILSELGGGRHLEQFFDREMEPAFFERLLHPLQLLEICERNPEGAVSYLQILRELAGERRFERIFDRDLGPEFVERMLHPRQLLEISGRNPEGALAYLRILRELGGALYFDRFFEHEMAPEFFERMLHPRELLEISERDPEGVVTYLQILRELGGGRYLERFFDREIGSEFFERILHPRFLLEISEHNPEGAMAYLQFLREFGGGRHFERFSDRDIGSEFFERMLHPRHLLEISERHPEAALTYLQILRELGGGRHLDRFFDREIGSKFVERMLHPRHLLEVSERNPEAALAYLQILEELDGGRYLQRLFDRDIGSEVFDRVLHPRHMLEICERSISSLRFWLVLARLTGSPRFSHALIDALAIGLADIAGYKRRLSELPIASLVDLQWLSEQTENSEIRSLVAQLA
jgi:hypothetical protein